ncbi:MAG TPA: hypothetical protein VL134_05495 [Leptolyngbya sp.]|nr:hypothetical protein [Leptolyngbya sp.]
MSAESQGYYIPAGLAHGLDRLPLLAKVDRDMTKRGRSGTYCPRSGVIRARSGTHCPSFVASHSGDATNRS